MSTTLAMTSKHQLLEAVEGHQAGPFISLIQGHEKKRKSIDLEELVLELERSEVKHIWSCLHAWADLQVTAFVVEQQQQQQEEEDQQERQEEGDAASGQPTTDKASTTTKYNEKVLEGIVKFAHIHVSTYKDGTPFIPEKMLEMTLLLHEMLAVLQGGVKSAVVALCELWWHKELEAQDLLMTNVLTYLLEAAIRKGGQKKDVTRVWKLHNSLITIDLTSPANEEFVELLITCISSPLFLSCEDGIKWVVSLFSWPSLIPLLHKRVRLAIPESTRTQSAKYGEIYFKAWKASQGDAKKTIEEECIQDLMYTAIHVNPLSSRPSANIHHLLHQIHSYKKHRAISTLIRELYQPILWRSFSVANGYVRMNAAGLLCDAFPLNDYNLNQEEQSDLLERQYHTLKTLLMDPCHLVRITAIKGVFNIFCKYWIIVPNDVIKAIFKTLFTVLVYDVTTSEVRLQVIKGLTLLLGTADAVPFLSQVLPRLGDVFDDANAGVREAFAKLLLKVKDSQALKYWDIVPVPHLLHRLEMDTPKVAQLVTRLLLSSFHPSSKGDEELLQRSLSLLEENRMAARKFYLYAGSMIGLPSVVHFMLLLWRCLANHIALHRQQQQQQNSDEEENESSEDTSGERVESSGGGRRAKHQSIRGGRRGERDSLVSTSNKENAAGDGTMGYNTSILRKDNEASKDIDEGGEEEKEGEEEEEESVESEEEDEVSPLDNLDVLCGILDVVGILWATNAHRLAQPQNNKYLEALRTKISKNYQHFFRYFRGNADASNTLLYIASFLPKAMVPTLVGHCMSQIRTMQAEQVVSGSDTSYKSYVNALCNWNYGDSLLELLSEWLEEGLKSGMTTSCKERRRSRRQVRFCETSTPKPQVALHIFCHILEHPLNRANTLQRHRAHLRDIIQDMDKIKDVIDERLRQNEELSPLCTDAFLCECWSLYLRLVVVCHRPPPKDLPFDSPACVSESLEWASSALVPYLGEKNGGKRKLQDTEEAFILTTTLLRSLVTSSTHLLMIGAVKIPFVYMLNDFVKILLEADNNGTFWDESLLLAHEGYEFLWVYGSREEEEEEECAATTPMHLATVCISSVSHYFQHHDQLPKESDWYNTLVGFLMNLGQRSREDQSHLLQHLMTCVVEHLTWKIEKNDGVDREVKCVQGLGGFVAVVVGALQKQSRLCMAAMDAFTHLLSTAAYNISSLLAACHLLQVLLQDSGKISRYSLKQTVVAANSVMSAVTGAEGETQEADNETAAETVKEILDEMKESLCIV